MSYGWKPWARKSSINLKEAIENKKNSLSSQEHTTLRRVKKLLALSSSSNKNEAKIALQKAQELSSSKEYKIVESSMFMSLIITHGLKKIKPEQVQIINILVDFFFIKAIFCSQYNQKNMVEEKVIEIFGYPTKAKIAEYVYWYLYNHIHLLWNDYKTISKVRGLKQKNEYFRGVLTGFSNQLKELSNQNKQQTSSRSNSLILSKENVELEKHVRYKHPKVSTTSCQYRISGDKVYKDGHQHGLKLRLHPGINRNSRKNHL